MKTVMYPLVTALGLSISAMAAPAAAMQEYPPAPSCEGEDGFHDFDFWLGTWDATVETPDGEVIVAGRNVITKDMGSCLVMENWINLADHPGTSMNFYNPVTDEWRQVWVSGGSIIDYTGGLNEEGSMVLVGTAYSTLGTPNSSGFRGLWTPNEDGTVRQMFEQVHPETGEWTVIWDSIYVRVEEDAEADMK